MVSKLNFNLLSPRVNCLPRIAGTIPPVLPLDTWSWSADCFPDGHFIMSSVQTIGEFVKNAIKSKAVYYNFNGETEGSLLFLLRRRK